MSIKFGNNLNEFKLKSNQILQGFFFYMFEEFSAASQEKPVSEVSAQG